MTTLLAPAPLSVTLGVIDSPACAMPQYSDYRRMFFLVSGSYLLSSANTYEEMVDAAGTWGTHEGARIVRVPVVPFYDAKTDDRLRGRAVGRPAVPGGTLVGTCGSGIWVRDTDRSYQQTYRTLYALGSGIRYMQDRPDGYDVGTTQAWWINGCSDNHPEQDGFWVECKQRPRHLGSCAALDLKWNWRDYAPWTDQGHNTQLSLF